MNNIFLELLRDRSRNPVVVAHRGDSYHAPENTLEAADRAFRAGADAWELDVQLTRDGIPVVLHDESLARTTDVATRFAGDPRVLAGSRLADFDQEEVQTLDAGSWFVSREVRPRSSREFGTWHDLDSRTWRFYSAGGVHVPTLVEALEFTRERGWLVNVELKSLPECSPRLTQRVFECLRETRTTELALVSSFDHREIARLAELRRGRRRESPLALGVLVSTPLANPAQYVDRIVGADTYHISAESLGLESCRFRDQPRPEVLSTAELSAMQSAEIPVLVYTVNEHQIGGAAHCLSKAGVAGLFTDDPAGMATHCPSWNQIRAAENHRRT